MKIFFIILTCLLINACAPQDTPPTIIGYIEADSRFIIAPEGGYLATLSLTEGVSISEGDTVAVLDSDFQQYQLDAASASNQKALHQYEDLLSGQRPTEITVTDAQIVAQQARLELAEHNLDRLKKLVRQNLASEQEVDTAAKARDSAAATLAAIKASRQVQELPAREQQIAAAKAALASTQANVEAAKWQLDRRTLRAEFSGIVDALYYHQGECVSLGRPVARVNPPKARKVRFFLPALTLSSVRIGQPIMLKADGLPAFDATISLISDTPAFTPPVLYSEPGREKLVYLVEAKIDQPDQLHPGMPVEIRL